MTGSSGIDEDAFAEDGGWQRGDGARLLLERRVPPDCHIKSAAERSENTVGKFGFSELAVGIVWHNNEEIEIAVLAGISSGLGAEKPNRLGFVGVGKAGYGIAERRGSSGFTRRNEGMKRLVAFMAWRLRVRLCFHSAGRFMDGCGKPFLPWVDGGGTPTLLEGF